MNTLSLLFATSLVVPIADPPTSQSKSEDSEPAVVLQPDSVTTDHTIQLGGEEITVFHGTQRSRLLSICQRGLLPGRKSFNSGDAGYFGDSSRGVYVTRYILSMVLERPHPTSHI